MALRVKISTRAASEIRRAARWWSINRPAAPGAIRVEIAEALRVLSTEPGVGSICTGTRVTDVRRLLMNRIRYFLYYRVHDESLEVLAFWHMSRGRAPRI